MTEKGGDSGVSGRYSQQDSGRVLSVRNTPGVSDRSSYDKGKSPISGRSPLTSSRKPSISLSARKAFEARQMEIDSVKSL